MLTWHDESAAGPRAQLRALFVRLERVRAGAVHDVLVARARANIATIRATRSAGKAAASRTLTSSLRSGAAIKSL
jgi:hypothetical protein